jgi:hypothetical protein
MFLQRLGPPLGNEFFPFSFCGDETANTRIAGPEWAEWPTKG